MWHPERAAQPEEEEEEEKPPRGVRLRNAWRVVQNPRSGWQHKAWGGVKRNPREQINTKTSPRSGRQRKSFRSIHDEAAVARFTGSFSWLLLSWGSASLHPRLYAPPRFAGLHKVSSPYLTKSLLLRTVN